MKIQGVKGTRDFYPEDMRLRNWITDTWRAVSLRNGFEQYDSPIFEYLDLFTIKSGEAIASELFSFTDRGGRSLAIRPETTPALARMVNAKINSLPRPIKWFTIQRCCRAENPQRGRLREFFCWNIDVIGSDSPTADAECVFVAADALAELGLTPQDVTIKYSSRALTGALLRTLDSVGKDTEAIFAVLDKRPKVDPDGFDQMLRGVVPDDDDRMKLMRFLNMESIDATVADSIAKNVGVTPTQDMIDAQANLQQFQGALEALGVAQWCQYDTNIVRGLAYYTGIVYEIFGRDESLRAVAGGGRYDDLLGALGGPQVGATGFGMGDVVLGLLLQQKGKVPDLAQALDFFVIDGGDGDMEGLLEVVGALRRAGYSADFSYKRQSIGKQLKEANRRAAARAVIVRGQTVALKDLATGEQIDRPLAQFLANPAGT